MRFRSIAFLTLLALPLGALAQDNKPAFDPSGARKAAHNPPPTPIDKMIALDLALGKDGVNWSAVWVKFQLDVNPNELQDTNVAIPIVLGMRMSDGVLAIKARDAAKLNNVASDIEALAKKLNVADAQLARAKKVRLYAGRNEWPRVFLELGYLQNDVLKTLQQDANVDRRALLIAAGWMQGLHAISNVCNDHYNDKTAGLLREPLLVEALLADLNALKPEKKSSPQAQRLIQALTEILPMLKIPMRANLPKEHVQKIAEISSTGSKELHKLAK